MVEVPSRFPLLRMQPFFDTMEKTMPTSGGLDPVNIDPWKCTGRMGCVEVYGPVALQNGSDPG